MKIKKTLYITLACLLLVANSCKKDFGDLNSDPHGFTSASNGSLFNGIIQSLIPAGNEYMYLVNEIIYKQTQQAALTYEAWGNYGLGSEDLWGSLYSSLPEIRELERRFSEMEDSPELRNMQAMLKIITAYKTFKLTDIYGDIPASDAGYGFTEISNEYLYPKYDKQQEIYGFLLDELKWADENIDLIATTEEPFYTFKSFDKLFQGDMLNWQKLANSLRLRHALRMYEKSPEAAAAVIKEVLENDRPVFLGYDFITSVLESACLWPNQAGFSNTGPDWAFHEQKNLRMGSNIWQQLSNHDSIDGSGIFDPRAYVFFETNNELVWRPYPQLSPSGTPAPGGIPYGYHRDDINNPDSYFIKGGDNIYSPVNYFLIRSANSVPLILITGAEVHYIKAEIYFRGIGVNQDVDLAEIEYLNGISSSVEWWIKESNKFKLPNAQISKPAFDPIPEHLNISSVVNVFGMWNATTDEEKLKFIYTQRWLDLFWQPWEAYALTRRTAKTPREGNPINHFRIPYPDSEATYNKLNMLEAINNQGGDQPENKIWWIP